MGTPKSEMNPKVAAGSQAQQTPGGASPAQGATPQSNPAGDPTPTPKPGKQFNLDDVKQLMKMFDMLANRAGNLMSQMQQLGSSLTAGGNLANSISKVVDSWKDLQSTFKELSDDLGKLQSDSEGKLSPEDSQQVQNGFDKSQENLNNHKDNLEDANADIQDEKGQNAEEAKSGVGQNIDETDTQSKGVENMDKNMGSAPEPKPGQTKDEEKEEDLTEQKEPEAEAPEGGGPEGGEGAEVPDAPAPSA